MLPVCLSLLLLDPVFFSPPALALDVTRWPPLFLSRPLNKQLRVGWIFFAPRLIAFSPLFSTPLGFKRRKKEGKTTGNVKEVFQITGSPRREDSAVSRQIVCYMHTKCFLFWAPL